MKSVLLHVRFSQDDVDWMDVEADRRGLNRHDILLEAFKLYRVAASETEIEPSPVIRRF